MKAYVEKRHHLSALFLRTTALAGVLALSLGTQAAFAQSLVYVPMGSLGKILVVDATADKIVNTINGVPAIQVIDQTSLVSLGTIIIDGKGHQMALPAGS